MATRDEYRFIVYEITITSSGRKKSTIKANDGPFAKKDDAISAAKRAVEIYKKHGGDFRYRVFKPGKRGGK